MRLGQRIGPMVLDRILRGNHQKRLRQLVGVCVHRDLALVHGLEQRRLCFGSGAVDFVGQQNVGENRAALELELLLHRRKNRDAEHVGRQHVAGELHPLKGAVNGPGQSLSERGFADPGNAFNQQVPAGENRHQSQAHHFVAAANHPAQSPFEVLGFVRNSGGDLSHLSGFYYPGRHTTELPPSQASELGLPPSNLQPHAEVPRFHQPLW
ncbi:hypothetical protein SBA1_730005 [Candidatus Sulfotelmatobacter kueseliae]|uniref:Uncharacterized protein n=1 Tax=Candidatus Sulfotelmatobacter kueseliae TaxID=2042962 RepID=A0A2U3L5V0_9BACT|nr:hypothetical protein SBA1_730005 [Candidatus Sulfotelmatobacter kueseliae]